MPTYLLTWNPAQFSWDQPDEEAIALAKGKSLVSRWSCGNSKSIPTGSRIFMLKQGAEGRGILAAGHVVRGTYQDIHWDSDQAAAGIETNFVRIRLENPISSDPSDLLDVASITSGALGRAYWGRPASGTVLDARAAEELEIVWAEHRASPDDPLPMFDSETTGIEGRERLRLVRHRSRESRLRDAKIQRAIQESLDSRLRCEVPECGFDFEAKYGSLGRGFAHVHHKMPLAEFDGPVEVSLKDLAIVCANCHAMIHRGGASRDLNTLIPHSEGTPASV
jgi:5-methylcytosine-specific restriction endonuclease McrA